MTEDFQYGLINYETKDLPYPGTNVTKVSFSRVAYCFLNKRENWIPFLSFSPTITGKYLFIFYKSEEDNICFFV